MRRTPVAVVLGAAALMLVACTPTIDLTAANEWAHAQFDAEKSQDDLLAMWVVTGSPEPATDDGDDGLDQYITTLGQRATVTGLRVRCFGGATMSVGVTVYTGSSAVGLGDEVECDEADHAIEVPGTLTHVHEITVRATAPVPTAGVVVVDGDAPDTDTWVDYFDDAATTGEYALQSWGSFGNSGDVAIVEHRDLDLRAGAHTVLFSCAGTTSAKLSFFSLTLDDTGEAVPDVELLSEDVDCEGGTHLEFRTSAPGLSIVVDSHGLPGAYLAQFDPGESVAAP